MIERRDFLKQSLAVTVGVMGSSAKAFASTNDFPTGLIYTSQNPGKWSENAKEHVPLITLEGKKVVIYTPHQITSKHYIVRHTLVAENGKVLGERTFYPTELTGHDAVRPE